MKYINVFASQSEYEQSVKTYPSVNLIKDTNDIICKYGNTPFYIEALEDLTVQFERSCEYNLGGGWTTLSRGTASPIVPAGQKIFIKASNGTTQGRCGRFTITGKCNIGGNLLSLYGMEYPEINSITDNNATFSRMFAEQPVCSAINLRIPISDASTSNLFMYMFADCIHLKYPPKSIRIYNSTGCCRGMFKGCESLLFAPELPSTTLTNSCYDNMFNGCKSLLYAPKLPATVVKAGCYGGMFANCTSLIQAPELLSKGVANYCYCSKIEGTTTTYIGMFEGCTSLERAPEIYSTNDADGCYRRMFYGCSKLNYIKFISTLIPVAYATTEMLTGVAPSGTFVRYVNNEWTPSSLPEGWTVETAEA